MIAIVIAAAQRSAVHGLDEHLPLPLFPLGDRPILHHVVDFLILRGVRRFEFMLGHLPDKIEAYLGDGARWGASFRFHLSSSASDPLALAQTVAEGVDDDIVVGRGDTLPEFELPDSVSPTLYVNDAGDWTGWAILPQATSSFAQLQACTSGKLVKDCAGFEREIVQHLSYQSVRALLRSQQDLLSGTFKYSEIGGRQTEPGIWVSRNVSIHRTVELKAPVYIGPNCKIEMGSRIGPFVVIGKGCVVDKQSSIANTLIAPRTYIGQGLELDQVIVDRNRLVNARLDTGFLVSDSFLLSGLKRQKRPRLFRRFVSRLAALALFLLFLPLSAPVLLFLMFVERGELVSEPAVGIPTSEDPHMWSECQYLRLRRPQSTSAGWWADFVAEVWLGLIAVIRGDLFLVGVRPRSRREVERLPSDWRSLYLSSKAGLITEAAVMFGRRPSEDELYTAEAYYTAVQSLHHDLRLLRLYLFKLLKSSDHNEGGEVAEAPSLGTSLENFSER